MDNETKSKMDGGDGQIASWWTQTDPTKSSISPLDPFDSNEFSMSAMPRTVHWSIPWSDLMMTMFILLAILFVYHASAQDTKKTESKKAQSTLVDTRETLSSREETSKKISTEISKLYETSQQTLKAADLKDIASVELIEDKAVRIILTGDVFFDTGKADLKPEAISVLQRVTGMLKETPHIVNVVGHTDNVPIHTDRFPSNWELSTARACVTARFLIDKVGVAPSQIYVSGYADYQPVESNDTPSGRLANRRVEIVISKEKPKGIAIKGEIYS
jgi:chemotaxis protein MotB